MTLSMGQMYIMKEQHAWLHSHFDWEPQLLHIGPITDWQRRNRTAGRIRGDADAWVVEMDLLAESADIPPEDRLVGACRADPTTLLPFDHLVLLLPGPDAVWVSDCSEPALRRVQNMGYTNWHYAPTREPRGEWQLLGRTT